MELFAPSFLGCPRLQEERVKEEERGKGASSVHSINEKTQAVIWKEEFLKKFS